MNIDFDPSLVGPSFTSFDSEEITVDLLTSKVFFCLVDDVADKLNIVKSSYFSFCRGNDSEIDTKYITLEERYGFNEETISNSLKAGRIFDKKNDFENLQHILKLIYSFNKILGKELSETGQFLNFEEAVNNLQQMKYDEEDLLVKQVRNENKFDRMVRKWRKERKGLIQNIQQAQLNIEKCIHDNDEQIISLTIQNICVEKWENSRQEMNSRKQDDKQREISDSLNASKCSMEDEKKSHESLTNYLELNTRNLYADIDFWIQKYEKDLDQYDQNITSARMKIENISSSMVKMRKICDLRKMEMDQWLQLKFERGLNTLLSRTQRKAVIKIQRWWRALMKAIAEQRRLIALRKKNRKKKKGKK